MNILDFGAVRGAFSGEAIQRAIDAAAAQGGGRVTVPAGVFETAGRRRCSCGSTGASSTW